MPTGCALIELLTEARLNMTLLAWNPRVDQYAEWLAFDALKEALPNYPELNLTSYQQRSIERDLGAEWLRKN